MRRVMSAHQPNFIPYLGFFDKMLKSDIFIIRDEVQFVERDWHHRNRIRIDGKDENGMPQSKWLTIPVKKENKDIKDIEIRNEVKYKNVLWNIYMLRQIKSNYETAPFFKKYFPRIEAIFLSKKDKLIELNIDIINFLKESFGIKTEILYASSINGCEETFNASTDLVKLCKYTQADIYLSGAGGKGYLDLEPFRKEGIEVIFQEFNHPSYKQVYLGFAPYMASIDALLNIGSFPRE